jgi:hypothetical protein
MKVVKRRKPINLDKYKELIKEKHSETVGDRKQSDLSPEEWYEAAQKVLEDYKEIPTLYKSLGIKKDPEDKLADDIAFPSNADSYKEKK